MGKEEVKTEGISEKHRRYAVAIEFWKNNKHFNQVEICEKFGFTESAMRSHLKRYNIPRPDGANRNVNEARKEWVRKAYNMALDQNLDASEASKWATKQHGSKIGRAEIQFYATKFDLPYLREAENFELGKLCKYA